MGFDPENIENAIKELDESLEEYNQKIRNI